MVEFSIEFDDAAFTALAAVATFANAVFVVAVAVIVVATAAVATAASVPRTTRFRMWLASLRPSEVASETRSASEAFFPGSVGASRVKEAWRATVSASEGAVVGAVVGTKEVSIVGF